MAGILEIRRRVRAVTSIEQVTRAMQMVAAAKLRRAQDRLLATRPYADALDDLLADLERRGPVLDHPFFRPRGGPVAYLVIGGDRGLCGAYNMNVVRRFQDAVGAAGGRAARSSGGSDDSAADFVVVAAGRRVRDFLARRGVRLQAEYAPLGEEIELRLARVLADRLGNAFEQGRCRELQAIYTRYISTGSQEVEQVKLLPLAARAAAVEDAGPRDARQGVSPGQRPAGGGAEKRAIVEYDLEPSPRVMAGVLLPRYLQVQVYRLLLESKASEHAARMRAMANATDNAEEMIDELTMEMNRERQAGITREIAEIVGGAEALRGR